MWIGACSIFSKVLVYRKENSIENNDSEKKKLNWFLAVVSFFPIIYIAASRDFNFVDTSVYVNKFFHMPDTLSELWDYSNTIDKDKVFYLFSGIIKIFISDDARVYLWIIAGIQGIVLIWFFNKYSESYFISIFLFVASTDMISWMFNGIRQFLAVVIILLATPFLVKRKYIPVILIILLAATMHLSALIMLPLVFVAQGKAWNKKTVFFIVATIIIIAFIGQFTGLLNESLSDTQYKNVISDYKEMQDNGTNFFRVLVYSVPAILSFVFRKKIIVCDDAIVNLSTNLSIISSGLYVVSMFTSGVFMGRMPIYCSLFSYLLLPWLIKNAFNEKDKRIVLFFMIISYLIFYYYQMSITWAMF